MDISATTKAIFDENKDIASTWFSVLARGPAGFQRFDLEKDSTLAYALRFLFFIALVELILSIPFAPGIGSKSGDKILIAAVVAETIVEYLVVALILHGAMKVFGGKGRLSACIAGYSFLTAYMPIISVLMFPTRSISGPVLAEGGNYPQIVAEVFAKARQLPGWDRTVLILSYLATTVVFVLFFTGVFRCFRALHKLGKGRARLAFGVGLLCSAAFEAMFVLPLLTALYKSFARS